MKKNTVNKILNPILFILIINQAVSAMFGSQMPPEAFEFFHEGGGIALVAGVALHLILNFGWVKANYFSH